MTNNDEYSDDDDFDELDSKRIPIKSPIIVKNSSITSNLQMPNSSETNVIDDVVDDDDDDAMMILNDKKLENNNKIAITNNTNKSTNMMATTTRQNSTSFMIDVLVGDSKSSSSSTIKLSDKSQIDDNKIYTILLVINKVMMKLIEN
ncbi:hypothetical protein HUG17_7023 [Dermatophagoides farinae]|uniref:Uncharacterized protein n=1 Tax=Dermatophagoides farinae TaxID=6954 RepID=A0A9D4SC08_DERFA|nr:hypothetical protein HUG17_7023 [Dermatophagoides farinae]